MDQLQFTLKNLTRRVSTGSHATQANRLRGLQAIADELKQLGFRRMTAQSLREAHVTKLVTHWKDTGIADVTIRNRLGWLRWWAEQINKPGVLPTDNAVFGLAERTPYQGNKARRADADTLARISDPRIRAALRLEAAFGLRREEALKFRPSVSIRGDRLALVPSTTKGGRYREIEITHPRQLEVLAEVKALAGTGSLIPAGMTYRDCLNRYKHQTRAAGLGNAHGLRHAWAQFRYRQLTGWRSPAAGGPTADRMTPDMLIADHNARLRVSRELGHGRIDVADTYLGRAKALAAGKRAA